MAPVVSTLSTASELPATEPQTIRIRPLSVHIGAEVSDVDLTAPLSEQTVREIREALVRWKVIFFRDQPLTHSQHIRFAEYFGQPTIGHPIFGYEQGFPQIYSVARDRYATRFSETRTLRPWTGWHTDVTAAVNPPAASILRGVDIPPYGGDTQWTDLEAAYQSLSESLRWYLDTLVGEHRFTAPEGSQAKDSFVQQVKSRELVSHHPLVRIHPESGRRSLFVSPSFLKRIVGLTPRESEHLLQLLFEQVVRPEHTVRFKWEPGSIAFWDNRSTAHLAPSDIYATDFPRQLYRITLVGDVPVGVNGLTSTAISGEPVLAHTAEG